MIANLNAITAVCGTNIRIHNISVSTGSLTEKAYYQHRHPGLEIHYIINGQCKVICGKNTYLIPEKTMLLIPPGTYHDVSPIEPNTRRLCLSFSLQKQNNSSHENTDNFYSIYNPDTPIITEIPDSEAQIIINRLIGLLNKNEYELYRNDKIITLCATLLLELIPHIANASTFRSTSESTAIQEDVSYKIDSFLGTNFMHNNAKSRMAENLYISPRQLQRIIQKNYGMNYRQKLSETRLQIAFDLLCNSDMPIHKIAEILGYSCSANFGAFIKRTTGKTPSQIRKEQ